jgi:inositol transport system ATP-binding protein
VRNLSKTFPGVKALDGVSLDLDRGQVHALVGENGAGKSTLMKILAGLDVPDAGEIRFKGRRLHLRSPHDALQAGLSMIHQELMPFPDLTVAENLLIGREPASRFPGWIDRRAMNREATRWLERLGVVVSPMTRMRDLSVAEMQTVEIAKALAHRAEMIIMDEPSSALSDREVDRLLEVIRDLKTQGVAVIYISHRLDEVFRIADTVTVLRDGRHIATHRVGDLTRDQLIALMVGRELSTAATQRAVAKGDVVLSVRRLVKEDRIQEVSFDVRHGEVLGLAGLMGAGRTDVVNAIYGLAPADAGEVQVKGRPVRIASPREALNQGIALVSEDRKGFGLVLTMSVKHNLTLANLDRYSRGVFIDHREENRVATDRIQAFAIKTQGLDQTVEFLSGGNQQKVVIAKALLTEPDILILDEPTRGIDIGAKAEVYAIISQLAREGKAIILVSSELSEILALSDRILVMREGTIAAELDPRQTTQEEILKWAMPD